MKSIVDGSLTIKKSRKNVFSHHSLIYNCIKHLLSFTIFKTLSIETMIKLWQTMKRGRARTRRHHRWQLPTGSAGWRRLHTGGCQSSSKVLSPMCPWRKGLWSQHSGRHPGRQMHLQASAVKALRELISQNEGLFPLKSISSSLLSPAPLRFLFPKSLGLWWQYTIGHSPRGSSQSVTLLPKQARLKTVTLDGLAPLCDQRPPLRLLPSEAPLSLWPSHVRAMPGAQATSSNWIHPLFSLKSCTLYQAKSLEAWDHLSSETSYATLFLLFIFYLQPKLPVCVPTSWASEVALVSCQCRRRGPDPWVRKIPWRRAWQPTPVFLPGEPLDRGAWQATVHGVTKNQTRLKQLSTHAQAYLCPTRLCKNRHNVPFARLQCQHVIQADAIIPICILPATDINIYKTK